MPDRNKKLARLRKKTPDKSLIMQVWRARLSALDKDVWAELPPGVDYFCFACGRPEPVQRAHIWPLRDGGTNTPQNIHLLCPNCHADSEPLSVDEYWQWFNCVPRGSGLRQWKALRQHFKNNCC